MNIEWRKQYVEAERDEKIGKSVAVVCLAEEDLTVQGDKDEADINVMLKRFGVTGQIRTVDRQALQGDFSDAPDLQTALNRVRAAEREFLNLPAELRAKLNNDPSQVEGWLSQDENRDEAIRLGLVDKPLPPIEPVPVRVLQELDKAE